MSRDATQTGYCQGRKLGCQDACCMGGGRNVRGIFNPVFRSTVSQCTSHFELCLLSGVLQIRRSGVWADCRQREQKAKLQHVSILTLTHRLVTCNYMTSTWASIATKTYATKLTNSRTISLTSAALTFRGHWVTYRQTEWVQKLTVSVICSV